MMLYTKTWKKQFQPGKMSIFYYEETWSQSQNIFQFVVQLNNTTRLIKKAIFLHLPITKHCKCKYAQIKKSHSKNNNWINT